MAEPHQTRGRTVLYWTVGGVALIAAAIFVPESWFESFQGIFGAEPQQTAFTDEVAEADQALQKGEALAADELNRLAPLIVARRLTRAGPMTADDMEQASEIWRRAMLDASNEPPEGSREAHFGRARRKFVEAFPRLEAERVHEEVDRFQAQVSEATTPPGGNPAHSQGMDGKCVSCHEETRELPGETKFDAIGIYPFMGDDPVFEGGRRFPVRVEAIELRHANDPEVDGKNCIDCHGTQTDPNFEVTMQDRVDNHGLWVNLFDTHPDLYHAEVKVKNGGSGHRAPAGPPRSAYVVTVVAEQAGKVLGQHVGKRLPQHLRTGEFSAGYAFARHLVDGDGSVTTDLDAVHDMLFDSRLASGRFTQQQYAFTRSGEGPVKLEVTLWYLPDYSTWKDAKAVRRAMR